MAAQESLPLQNNPPPTSAARAFLAGVSETGKAALARQKPWSELLDRHGFSKPESLADASSRMRKNLSYFRVNYAVFTVGVLGLSLLWHPGSLIILLVLLAAWVFLYFSRTEPLVLFNRPYSDKEVLVVLGVATFIVIFLTKTGSTVLTGLATAAAVIAIHAVLRFPDDLFLEDQENASGGFLSFQPQVASRV